MLNYKETKGNDVMKRSLREEILQQIKRLNHDEKQAIEKAIHHQLFKQAFWKDAKVIGITHSTDFEWDTKTIIQQAWQENKVVVLPKSNQEHKKLSFYQINQFTELEKGYANILEPIETLQTTVMNKFIDLLLVPGIMFDVDGYRLGFGGGFYDRYLIEQDHRATTVSLASEFQLVEKLPRDDYDIPVDYIITNNSCLATI